VLCGVFDSNFKTFKNRGQDPPPDCVRFSPGE